MRILFPKLRLAVGNAVLLLLAFSVVAEHVQAQGPKWRTGVATPAWVDPVQLPEIDGDLDNAKWGDVRMLLIDDQLRTDRRTDEVFHHRAQQVITTTGMGDASRIVLEFDPSYMRLEVHGVWIHRDGERREALSAAQVSVIQQEDDLDRRIYDGSEQFLAFLSDVRVGDVVEWSWTLKGRNPALGENMAVWRALGWSTPVSRVRIRFLSRPERPLQVKHFNSDLRPEVSTANGWTEHLWTADDLAAVVFDDSRPSWWVAQPLVQVTDFESWKEVASWAEERYAPLVLPYERMPRELKASVDEWRALDSDAARTEAALRFVQDDVRYLGIEIGSSGLIPHDPAVVYSRRFGDCKDKALLLVSILRAMDIKSNVALLDTDWLQSVEEMLPATNVFNHAIAVAEIDGKQTWMDATRSLQRGALASRPAPDYRRALIVADDTESLSGILTSEVKEPQQEIVELFEKQEDGSATLTVTTTTRGDSAESSRYSFAGNALADTERSYLNFYVSYYSDIEADGAMTIDDDEAGNVVTVTEHYRLPELWDDGNRYFYGWSIDSELARPTERTRSAPFAVDHPVWSRHTIQVKGIGKMDLDSPGTTVSSVALTSKFEATSDSTGVELTWNYRSRADHVAPDDLEAHIDAVDRVDGLTAYVITPSAELSEYSFWWLLLFPILGAIGTGFWLAVKESNSVAPVAKLNAFRLGESPATAANGPIESAVPQLRCRCGGSLASVAEDPAGVMYGDRETYAVETRCQACGTPQTAYVT